MIHLYCIKNSKEEESWNTIYFLNYQTFTVQIIWGNSFGKWSHKAPAKELLRS